MRNIRKPAGNRYVRLGSSPARITYPRVFRRIWSFDGLVFGLHPMNPSEVLLVEDSAGDALLIGQALAECPKPVHLHIARDGEQALQILKAASFKPDLIILDLNIPKISGYAVLALSHPENTPVVVFTASSNEADERRALSLGAKEFVHKPMDFDEYKAAVSGMVKKWAA